MKVTCDKVSAINLDGEIRSAKEAEFRISDKKLRFFYPKTLSWKKEKAAL